MKKSFLFLSCLFFFSSGTFVAQTPAALSAFLKKTNLSHAAVSFKAVDLSAKKIIASYNENVSLTPASSLKIVTTATALDLFGENFYFETPLCYDGSILDSILYGNLYIKGSGDPTLGSEFMPEDKEYFLKKWLVAIKEAGIKRISGRIIVLDQLFGYEGVSPKWLWEDMGTYYAPGVYGISVFDNMYRIYLQSFEPGGKTSILYTDPMINHLQLRNEIKASRDLSDEAAVSGLPFSNEMRLYGTIPANKSSFVVKGAIPDPGLFLANYLHDYLQKNGIFIEGQATTYRLNPVSPSEEKELEVVRSVDLASIIQGINVRSDNLYAEHIYKVLTVLDSIDISKYWQEKGLDSSALFMVDGSGISPKNALSAGFLVDLLIYMNEQSGKSSIFRQSLPLAGKEGTVASFLKNTFLSGKARLKSGSMSNVQSYSGYIESKGRQYAIALIVNNFTGKRADLRKEIEQLFIKLF